MYKLKLLYALPVYCNQAQYRDSSPHAFHGGGGKPHRRGAPVLTVGRDGLRCDRGLHLGALTDLLCIESVIDDFVSR
jgi:hypothetical protein